ncbi:uncharacterized protein [Porites lutea]|uniref:uncharacterized protein n=1 Tax=Porites lutea TaxID=51062 RepID=UPI003CC51B11
MSESEYKNLLFQISKRLDNRNAGKQLLVICRGKVAARRDEENIPTFTLFVELEVKGFLSSDRLTVLKAILKGVKEWDFLEEVEKFECRRKNYNNLLEKIIRVLDVLNDLERLISICRGNITEGRRASIHDVRSLFRELESNGCLGIDCLTTLKEILIQTEKIDLLKRVNMLEQHHFIDGADIMRIVGDSLSRQLDEGALVWSFVRQMTGVFPPCDQMDTEDNMVHLRKSNSFRRTIKEMEREADEIHDQIETLKKRLKS